MTRLQLHFRAVLAAFSPRGRAAGPWRCTTHEISHAAAPPGHGKTGQRRVALAADVARKAGRPRLAGLLEAEIVHNREEAGPPALIGSGAAWSVPAAPRPPGQAVVPWGEDGQIVPPSARTFWPVSQRASGEQSGATASAISCGWPCRGRPGQHDQGPVGDGLAERGAGVRDCQRHLLPLRGPERQPLRPALKGAGGSGSSSPHKRPEGVSWPDPGGWKTAS
jgi:hypothetical protein